MALYVHLYSWLPPSPGICPVVGSGPEISSALSSSSMESSGMTSIAVAPPLFVTVMTTSNS